MCSEFSVLIYGSVCVRVCVYIYIYIYISLVKGEMWVFMVVM